MAAKCARLNRIEEERDYYKRERDRWAGMFWIAAALLLLARAFDEYLGEP
jgi:hypothetical protein